MRFRRRYLILACASVAALSVGGTAFAHDGNVSSLPTWQVAPGSLPGSGPTPPGGSGAGATAPVSLSVQTHTNYGHPGIAAQSGKAKTVTLNFDDDVVVNLAGIPTCTPGTNGDPVFNGGTTLATAWNGCGPGPVANPNTDNSYVCAQPGTNGLGSTNTGKPIPATCGRSSTAPASNFGGCTLVFKGANNNQLIIFARTTTVANSTANCANPSANNTGNVTTTLIGTLSNPFPAASDLGTRLNVPGVDALAVPLDDFTAKVQRGGAFRARCVDDNNQINLETTFDYTDAIGAQAPHNAATDTVNEPGGSACS